jgi:predicted dienelactone hydrolase
VVPDVDDKPRDVGIWYPSEGTALPQALGPYRQTVAADGAMSGHDLPLIIVLHGLPGSFANHYHTALALAEAGFVVAGVTQGNDIRVVERPRHTAEMTKRAPAVCQEASGFDRSAFHREFNAAVVAFFRTTLPKR